MSELFEQIFQSFWTFLGTAFLISIPCDAIVRIIYFIFNGINVRKHGWPPAKDKKDN